MNEIQALYIYAGNLEKRVDELARDKDGLTVQLAQLRVELIAAHEANARQAVKLARAEQRAADFRFELDELYGELGWCDELTDTFDGVNVTELGHARDVIAALLRLCVSVNEHNSEGERSAMLELRRLLKDHDLRQARKAANLPKSSKSE